MNVEVTYDKDAKRYRAAVRDAGGKVIYTVTRSNRAAAVYAAEVYIAYNAPAVQA